MKTWFNCPQCCGDKWHSFDSQGPQEILEQHKKLSPDCPATSFLYSNFEPPNVLTKGESFGSEYYAQPAGENERRLVELAQQYLDETESFDRSVCTGPIVRGAIMPRGAQERFAISQFATARMKVAERKAAEFGFAKAELMRAIRELQK